MSDDLIPEERLYNYDKHLMVQAFRDACSYAFKSESDLQPRFFYLDKAHKLKDQSLHELDTLKDDIRNGYDDDIDSGQFAYVLSHLMKPRQ